MTEFFTLIGVTYHLNLEEMILQNIEPKILEMKNIMKMWSTRKLTVMGRVVVVKTLIIPKIKLINCFTKHTSYCFTINK